MNADEIARKRELLKDEIHHNEVSRKDMLAALDEIERLRKAIKLASKKLTDFSYSGGCLPGEVHEAYIILLTALKGDEG